MDSAKNHYVLAEKLWSDQKYVAAVAEFERAAAKDPRSLLGQQANYRAAMTQFLFLFQYNDAIRKFKSFVETSSDGPMAWDAQIKIGEILFSKLDHYDQAIVHYQSLIREKPTALEVPEFFFRIAKSQFYLFQFKEALKTFRELNQRFPKTKWGEKAEFEVGITYFTCGEHHSEELGIKSNVYESAIEAYKRFIQDYPQSELVGEAHFGVASCLEELDRLDEALIAFEGLKKKHPSPYVIDVKLNRIRQRLVHREGRKTFQ